MYGEKSILLNIMISNEVVNYNKMLEFTLLGYCLRRSSFKLRVAHVALSPAKRHRQLCLRWPLSGTDMLPTI